MLPEDINIFFFGSPSTGFSTYPKEYEKLVKNYDTTSKKLDSFSYENIGDKYTFYFIKCGLTASSLNGNIRGARNFGICIELKGYKLDQEIHREVENFVEDFLKKGIIEYAEVFSKNDPNHYAIKAFEHVSQKLDNVIFVFKKKFSEKFKEQSKPILDIENYSKVNTNNDEEKDDNKPEYNQDEETDLYLNPNVKDREKENQNVKTLGEKKIEKIEKLIKILTIVSPILIILCFCIFTLFCLNKNSTFKFTYLVPHINNLVNILSITCVAIFIFIVFYKYFKEEELNGLGDDNKFIAMTTIIAISAICLACNSKVVSENGGNIGKLISHSMFPHEFELEVKDTIPSNIIFCIDVSGSTEKLISRSNYPQWLKKDSSQKIYKILEKDSSIYKEKIENNKLKEFELLQLKVFKAIHELENESKKNNFTILLFGTQAEEYSKNITSFNQVKEIIPLLENNDQTTDFEMLFKKLDSIIPNNIKNKYQIPLHNIVIFSDFIHDVNYSSNKENLERYFNKIIDKQISLNFSLFQNNYGDSLQTNSSINLIKFIQKLLDQRKITYNLSQRNDYSDIINTYVNTKDKLYIYYKNPFYDSCSGIISYQKKVDNSTLILQHIGENYNFRQIYNRKILKDAIVEEWEIQNRKISFLKNEKIELRYDGSFYSQNPKYSLNISDKKQNITYLSEVVFIQKISKTLALLISSMLIILFFFQSFYLIQIIIQKLKKNVKTLHKI